MPWRAEPGWRATRVRHRAGRARGLAARRRAGVGRLVVGTGLAAVIGSATQLGPALPAAARPFDLTPVGAAGPAAPRSWGGAPVPVLRWRPCGGPYLCASAVVPLDWTRPQPDQGPTIALALIELPAKDPRHRIGTLFVNPGGPGGSGVELVRDSPESIPAAVRERYDLVGFDPRLIGASRPVATCLYDDAFASFEAGQPAFPVTSAQEHAFAAAQAGYTARCAERSALRFASTASVARDLDLLRVAVGDPQLSYVGFSYGSYLGQVYAQLYPRRVRAIVLDGVVDAAAWTRGESDDWRVQPFTARLGSAAASSRALHEFFLLCSRAGRSRCALAREADPAAAFDRLAAALLQAPIDLGNGAVLDYPSLVNATVSVLYSPLDWQGYADELESTVQLVADPAARSYRVPVPQAGGPGAMGGPARGLVAQRGVVAARSIRDRGTAPPRLERPRPTPSVPPVVPPPADNPVAGFDAVSCEDGLNPDEPWHWSRAADEQERQAPYFGRAWTWSGLACASWALADPNTYQGPFGRATSAPILVVGNRFDPATPYQAAVATARRFAGARLLTIAGYGHTSGAAPSRCAQAVVSGYLLYGRLPAGGAVCQQDVPPFPP